MSVRNSNTTSDYIPWDTMLSLVHRLFNDGDYRMSLFIGCGSFFGLRVSDLKQLTWSMLLDGESFVLNEQKTGKRRIVKVNHSFQRHIQDCYDVLGIKDKNEPCFLSKRGTIITTQNLNIKLKEVKVKYRIKVEHLSCHSLRKTFGRRVVEQAGENSEMALIRLSEIFNHSTPAVTRRYLGIRQEELDEVYDCLSF